MKILILSFYYEPDLSAGSFRSSSLVKELKCQLGNNDTIDVVTTMPNRYSNFKTSSKEFEKDDNINIRRIKISNHKSGFIDQSFSYIFYLIQVIKFTNGKNYDLVFATTSRLFTGFLGAMIAKKKKIPLYLDVRDIFADTLKSILSKTSRTILLPVISLIESYTYNTASKINLVSYGFRGYLMEKDVKVPLSFFSNGIDDDFLIWNFNKRKSSQNKKIITYAGNIGKGQGLDCIIPKLSLILGDDYEIRIIGNGGAFDLLEKELYAIKTNNIKIFKPVGRKKLLEFYAETDYLFLHLNDVPAFKKVLPSKIFEYAATGKPIIAGVEGFSKKFLEENVQGVFIFKPCDEKDFERNFKVFHEKYFDRTAFCERFSRKAIMKELVRDLLSTVSD